MAAEGGTARDILTAAGRAGDGGFDLAETALALAALDRPELDLTPYRAHLETLCRDLAAAVAARGQSLRAIGRAAILAEVLAGTHGYAGDRDSYDDVANADLARVIDRRKGLPVALSILWLHAGRAQGWAMAGLNFPGHFFLRLDGAGGPAILDPFAGGRTLSAGDAREMVEAITGGRVELTPEHAAPVSDRALLLRLQNNIKLRLLRAERHEDARRVVERMSMLAPRDPGVWHELAELHSELGNLRAAIGALEKSHDAASPGQRAAIGRELTRLRAQLN